jgi:hypothetical protein
MKLCNIVSFLSTVACVATTSTASASGVFVTKDWLTNENENGTVLDTPHQQDTKDDVLNPQNNISQGNEVSPASKLNPQGKLMSTSL